MNVIPEIRVASGIDDPHLAYTERGWIYVPGLDNGYNVIDAASMYWGRFKDCPTFVVFGEITEATTLAISGLAGRIVSPLHSDPRALIINSVVNLAARLADGQHVDLLNEFAAGERILAWRERQKYPLRQSLPLRNRFVAAVLDWDDLLMKYPTKRRETEIAQACALEKARRYSPSKKAATL